MQPNLVLIRGLPDGKVEWIRLDGSIRHVSAAPNETYTLIDRAAYEAPKTLVAERVGENLVLEVEGAEAVVIDGFFSTAHVAFYPTTNIAGGAGPFSGAPLTADSPVLAGSTPAEQVLWSAEPMQSSNEEVEPAVQTTSSASGGGTSPMLWVGLGAGALGLAALAGGGGGSGGGESGGGAAVTITSGGTAAAIAESSGVDQVVYRATASTAAGTAATFSLAASGDAAAFTIDANTGEVRLSGNPNYEDEAELHLHGGGHRRCKQQRLSGGEPRDQQPRRSRADDHLECTPRPRSAKTAARGRSYTRSPVPTRSTSAPAAPRTA